jgi:uncharacterized protein
VSAPTDPNPIAKELKMKTLLLAATAAFAAFAATPADAATSTRVTLSSQGERLVGDLHLPANGKPKASFVIIGPMTYQKGQAPSEYAKRLAKQGYAALVFDVRGRGESGGAIRALESPKQKIEDLGAAISFVRSQASLADAPIFAMGICQGSSYVVQTAADNNVISGAITVAGHYRDQPGNIAWLTEDGFKARLAQADAAKAKFERTLSSQTKCNTSNRCCHVEIHPTFT